MAAASTLPASCSATSSSGAILWFDGRLDNTHDFVRGSISGDDRPRPDADVALAAYEQLGGRFVSRLNGDFALALVDLPNRTMILARDVMASQPLYYCPLRDRVLFA